MRFYYHNFSFKFEMNKKNPGLEIQTFFLKSQTTLYIY